MMVTHHESMIYGALRTDLETAMESDHITVVADSNGTRVLED